jgi:transcriptional regulator with XRE-family HTH domain
MYIVYYVSVNLASAMDIQSAFAKIIREERRKQNLSQLVLSEKAALHLNTVQALESGKYAAKITTLFQLCRALDVSAASIIDRVEDLSPEIPTDAY